MQAGPRGCILEFMSNTDRFQRAIRSIDEANGEDPNSEVVDGVAQPKELLYGVRMQEWVEKLDSRAPEALRIAARSQHIRRWEIGDVPAAVEFGRVAAAPVNTLRQQTHRCQEISVCF